ncbi:MAG: hypothetical protein J5819_04145 [Eubacterium sp.]|nr:hypothetical protein [Eubacterium sp.]
MMIYLPESFEWMILKSGVVNADNREDVLANPENYIESSVWFSWERFFTNYLSSITQNNSIIAYQKHTLKPFYLERRVKESILSVIPNELRGLFE